MYQDVDNLFQNVRDVGAEGAGTYKSNPNLGALLAAAGVGVDLLVAGNDPGSGEPVKIHTMVTEAFAGGTSVDFRLVQADDEALTTNLETIASSGAIVTASLVAGYRPLPNFIPREAVTRRYIGLDMVVVGVMTAGIVTSGIVWDDQSSDSDWTAVTGF
jgi:hypothetical protein